MEPAIRYRHSSRRVVRCARRVSSQIPMALETAVCTICLPLPGAPTPAGAYWRSPIYHCGDRRQRHLPHPTPLFGLGLVEATPDAKMQANLTATAGSRAALKIGGSSTPMETTARSRVSDGKRRTNASCFSWARLTTFEQGVTNEVFPNERNVSSGCAFNNSPEDVTPLVNGNPSSPNFNTTVGTPSESVPTW